MLNLTPVVAPRPGASPHWFTLVGRPLALCILLMLAACGADAPTPTPESAAVVGAGPAQYVFPVQPALDTSYSAAFDDFPATDIFCPAGSLFVSPTAGVVEFVSTVDQWDSAVDDPTTRGGIAVAIVGDDSVRYYGAHLASIETGIVQGVRVVAGQPLGRTGQTGVARNGPPRLHFGISPPTTPDDWQTRQGTVEPYQYLVAWADGIALRPRLQ